MMKVPHRQLMYQASGYLSQAVDFQMYSQTAYSELCYVLSYSAEWVVQRLGECA